MTCTTGTDKDKGGYYIFQYIAPLVWARKPVVCFAPLVRLTPLSPIFSDCTVLLLNSAIVLVILAIVLVMVPF